MFDLFDELSDLTFEGMNFSTQGTLEFDGFECKRPDFRSVLDTEWSLSFLPSFVFL